MGLEEVEGDFPEGVFEVGFVGEVLTRLITPTQNRVDGRKRLIQAGTADQLIVAALNGDLAKLDAYREVAEALGIDVGI